MLSMSWFSYEGKTGVDKTRLRDTLRKKCSNTGKYGLEKTPYLDTFHAVIRSEYTDNTKDTYKFVEEALSKYSRFFRCDQMAEFKKSLWNKVSNRI